MNALIKIMAATVIGVAVMGLSAIAQNQSAADAAASESLLIKQYFPLVDGDFREYSAIVYYVVHEQIQTWTEMLDGKQVFALQVADDYGNTATYYLRHHRGKLVCYAIGGPWEGLMKFDPPLILLCNNTLAADRSRTQYSTLTWGNQKASILVRHSVVSLRDPVTVPAGTYSDCKRVRIRMTVNTPGMDPETGVFVWVLAPSIGIIKDRFFDAWGSPNWFELESATGCRAAFFLRSTHIGAGGEIITRPVTAADRCEWMVVNPCSDWIVVSPMSGTGDTTITINVAANTSSEPRMCTLTIGDSEFEVLQDGNASPSRMPTD